MLTAYPDGKAQLSAWAEPFYHQLPAEAPVPVDRPKTSSWKLKFGKQKDVPIADLADDDLAWYAKTLGQNVDDPEKSAYRDKNQRDLDAVKAEQAWRRANPGRAAA
jgi:hypothetical protein